MQWMEACLFFCCKRKDKLKTVYWHNTGFCKKKLEQKNQYIKTLESTSIDFKKNRFGSKSEKKLIVTSNQLPLFSEVEVIADTKIPNKAKKSKKKSGVRKALSKELERIEKVHDLDKEQKICLNDGTPLKHIGEVAIEQFYLKPAVVKVIKHKQYKYVCPNGTYLRFNLLINNVINLTV